MADLNEKFKSALIKKETLRVLEEESTSESRFVYAVHNYEADPQSGAGNCKHCARPQEDRRHPHVYRKAAQIRACVCTLPKSALIHLMTQV